MRLALRPKLRKLRSTLFQGVRTTSKPLCAAVFALALVWTTVAVVVPFVRNHDYFRLRTVRVSCDHPSVSPKVLASIAGLWHDTTIWDVDVREAERALEGIPWVRDATVVRHFPWKVTVRVSRRHAVAATLVGDGVFLIDEEGAVFREPGEPGLPDLLFVRGWHDTPVHGERIDRLRRSLALAQEVEAAGRRVSEVSVDAAGVYWLYLEEPRIAVATGTDPDPHELLARLAVALDEVGDDLELARELDLGWGHQLVVRARNAAAQTVLAARLADRSNADRAVVEEVEGRG